ncbi:hypothetical protein PVAP13_1KG360400 [Panicum virgatum]|uniref:Protein NBR1 homolog n=1 Tax=Panicum virgatum TaxID=38727 RepID=A0A8T0XQN6_PANVG|nr:hypothetical protein PVAP13_1KG360400 [Panicum virgatum]
MSDRSSPAAPTFFPFGPQAEAWDVTFKVKYGDTLKRFYGCVNGAHFDMNLSALRAKIATAFKFGPDANFILTYIDEDGDAVMLDDDDDLRDAALRQKLNPLRITVQLKKSQPTEQKEKNSTPVKPTPQDPLSQIMSAIEGLKPAQEENLAHIKSAIGEAFKSIPEPIPDALAKLSHEVLDAAPPPLAELMKPFVQMMAPSNSGNGSSDAHADGSSSSSSGVTEAQAPANKDEPKAKACLGLRSVLEEAPAPAAHSAGASLGQQPSMYPSVEELLFPSNSVDISVCKGKIDAQSTGKSVMSSATQAAPRAVPIHAPPPPPPCVSEWFRSRRSQPLQWQFEDNAKVTNDSKWRIPMYKVPYASPAAVPPPGYVPSPHFPYPGRLLSSGHPYADVSGNMENSTPRSLHRWIQCDGCGVQPIVGPRYKSNVKEDYDLCDSCFLRMGNKVEYTKIDKPISPHRLLRDPHAIPVNGFPVDKEIDVAVDFVAPTRPGRYISYWRLASPSGQKFGQRVWVHIQVEDPSFANDNNRNAAINLNLPPESNSTNTSNLIDVNMEPAETTLSTHAKRAKEFHFYPIDVPEPKESQPAVVTSMPAAAPANPTVDVPMSSATIAAFVPSVSVPAPELVVPAVPSPPVNVPIGPTAVSVSAPPHAPAPASASVSVPASMPVPPPVSTAAAPEPFDTDDHNEEKLLRELEEMGFRQIDLNKEILRQNNYNLEQSVDDLCGVNEWDPLLAELEEMGFDDTEMNKELLAKNGGSIKRAVMDLIAREKKDK